MPRKRDWPSYLQGLRAARGLTQIQMAARLHVSASAYIKWENDQRVPSRLARKVIEYELKEGGA